MRLDHWIKQLFILPGLLAAVLLTHTPLSRELALRLCAGFFATCLIASANYVINEWLDAAFDKFHPTKKYRSVVSEGVDGRIVWLLWGCLSVLGFALALLVNIPFLLMCVWLWAMGLLSEPDFLGICSCRIMRYCLKNLRRIRVLIFPYSPEFYCFCFFFYAAAAFFSFRIWKAITTATSTRPMASVRVPG